MGAGQPHCAKIAAYKSVYMGVAVAVISTGGLFIVSAYLPGWLTPDPTLQSMIFECLPLVCRPCFFGKDVDP
jgi:Na+-driven multidrug efflux pump